MDNTTTYRPHRACAWFVVPVLVVTLICYIIAGCALSQDYTTCLFWLIFGTIGVLCTKALYDSAKITIYLDNTGIRIVGNKHTPHYYATWEQFPYLFRGRSFKGHTFLLLSPKHMDQAQINQLTNKAANSNNVCVDSVIIIYLDAAQDTSAVVKAIEHRFGNIAP